MRLVTGCICSAILASALTTWFIAPSPSSSNIQAQEDVTPLLRPRTSTPDVDPTFDTAGLSPEEVINVNVYETANRGVVNITTRVSEGIFLLEVASEGTGSGAVIDRRGHVLTNYHVVENANKVDVTLFNGKTYSATLVGADAANDVAVVRINAPQEELHPIKFGSSNRLKVGMRVFAIGNPFGLERTMTTGIISSLNRSLAVHRNRTIKSIIQIDAAVNPGNSGGPLLDSQGRLIGINTAIASSTGQSAGVGFAIPVGLVGRLVPELIQHGHVIRAEIGIQRVFETDNGLLIAQLTPDGPAAKAGLLGPRIEKQQRGPIVLRRINRDAADLIVQVDGEPVESASDFLAYIETKKPGDVVELGIIRQSRKMKVEVVLGGGSRDNSSRSP